MNQKTIETHIRTLGEAKIPSPMLEEEHGGIHHLFVSDEDQAKRKAREAGMQPARVELNRGQVESANIESLAFAVNLPKEVAVRFPSQKRVHT